MSTHKFAISITSLSLAVLIILLLATGPDVVTTPAAVAAEMELFTRSAREGSLYMAGDPTIIRARFVDIDFDLLGGADDRPVERYAVADSVVLNLFDDAVFTAVLDRVELNRTGGYSWIGRLEGVEHSQVILVVLDGLMAGNITVPDTFYQVRYAGDGVQAIYEIDQSAFPPEVEPIPVETFGERAASGGDITTEDDGSFIDVLVAYTGAARSGAGGTSAMNTLINLAVAETNTSYSNSGIDQRLRLVHTEEVSYSESGFNWYTTIDRLRLTSDGYMDNVHPLRDAYGADCVVLIVNNGGYCGLGYMMSTVSSSFESLAFSLVSRTCATGYYSFAHELGHNMGARHDWYVDTGTNPYEYAHGFVNTGDSWRTIMGYNTECSPGYCTRLQYWSNPDVSYGGDPMGVPEGSFEPADNRKTLNNTAYTVANFRESTSVIYRVNFQPDGVATPTGGYYGDSGGDFGNHSGPLGTKEYGWR